MNVLTPQCHFFGIGALLLVITAASLSITPQIARAATADADSAQTVDCLLPGQIHNVGGHPTMGPRRPIQTTPADCRVRGGEYTVNEHASQAVAVPHVASALDSKIVSCLLPRQERQLGEKAHYTKALHTVHITRADCEARGGDVVVPTHAHHTAPKK